jgi:hypothetical protein
MSLVLLVFNLEPFIGLTSFGRDVSRKSSNFRRKEAEFSPKKQKNGRKIKVFPSEKEKIARKILAIGVTFGTLVAKVTVFWLEL